MQWVTQLPAQLSMVRIHTWGPGTLPTGRNIPCVHVCEMKAFRGLVPREMLSGAGLHDGLLLQGGSHSIPHPACAWNLL